MIVVKLIEDKGGLAPERELEVKEQQTVTSVLFNGVDVIYYQGDEPIINEILE